MLLEQEGTPAGKMLTRGCACVNLTFKGPNVISVYLATMDQVANLASAQALDSMKAPVRTRLDSVCVEPGLKAIYAINVLLAISTTHCVNFVAAVLLGPCPKAVMLLGNATVGLSMMDFTVTSAVLDIIPTLTVKLVLVTSGARWTATATPLVNAAAVQITLAEHATSVPQASMGFLLVQLATVP